MADLSIEVGHFYADTIAQGPEALAERFAAVGHFAAVAAGERSYSTAFMIDDYHNRSDASPGEIIPAILEGADRAGLRIDYVAREAACLPLATSLLNMLVERVGEGAPEQQGWMPSRTPGQFFGPRSEICKRLEDNAHLCSTGVDIEIWSTEGKKGKQRTLWACPFLASVWQALRLRALHDPAFEHPYVAAEGSVDWSQFGEKWDDLPPLTQLNPTAAPFNARRTFSILPAQFIPVEIAVQSILRSAFPEEQYRKNIGYAFLADI